MVFERAGSVVNDNLDVVAKREEANLLRLVPGHSDR
jgi:hypothetical protein